MLKILVPGISAREIYAAFVFYHGYAVFSFVVMFPASLVPQLKQTGYELDTTTEALLGALPAFVSATCTFFHPIIISKTGRKTLLQIPIVISAVGMSVVALAPNITTIHCGMIIATSALSVCLSVTGCYISEICRKERRGVLLTGGFIMASTGSAMVFFLHKFLSWRMMAAGAIAIALSGFIQSFLIPESSYWHVLRQDSEKAKKSLRWFQPMLNDVELDRIIGDMSRSTDKGSPTTANGSPFFEFLRNLRERKVYWPLLKTIAMNVMRSGSGRAIFGLYFITIVQDLKISYDVQILSTILGITEVFGSMAMLYLVSKLERKIAIFVCSSIMIVCLGTVVVSKILLNCGVILPAFIPMIGIYVYMVVVLTGFYSLLNIIGLEIQVAVFRAEAYSVITATTFYSTGFHMWIFPYVRQVMPIEYVLCYFIFCTIATTLFIHFGFPETSKLEFYENENKNDTDEINKL